MPSNIVLWGLLSTARINERFISAIRASKRAQLLAVASRDATRAAEYAGRWDIPRAHAGYQAMLDDPSIDAVYISLPNGLHVEWCVRAAESGKHVLCEKPLALSADEVDRIDQAAREHGVVVQEATMMRFHPQMKKVTQLVAERAIGPVRLVRGRFTFQLKRPNDVRWVESLGGGSVWDVGSYPVNFMRTALGENPVEVHGIATDVVDGVDGSFTGQLRFPSGAAGQFFSSFRTIPCADAEILGTAGYITLDMPWLNKSGQTATLRVFRGREGKPAGTFSDAGYSFEEETIAFDAVNAYFDEHEAMVASILDGAPPVIPLADSRANAATLAALCQSAREGRSVIL